MMARTSPRFNTRRIEVPASHYASRTPETLIALATLVCATGFVLTILAATETCADEDGGILIGTEDRV